MKKLCRQLSCNDRSLCFLMKPLFWCTLVALIWYLFIPRSGIFFRNPVYKPVLGGLYRYDVVLRVGDTYTIFVNTINKRITYQSSDIKVATVNLLGSVRTWRAGTTIIKVKYEDKTLKCRIRVIDLSQKSITNHVGDKKRVYVKNAFFGVKYRSSNTSVATIDRFGFVHSVGEGKATITATYKGKQMRCKVHVKE